MPTEILTHDTIDDYIQRYLANVRSIRPPSCGEDLIEFITVAKRRELGCGPYPSVSMFEAFNRILSDLIVLFGVRRLLVDDFPNIGVLPYTHYRLALGNEDGNDIHGSVGDSCNPRLVGEAFNVSSAYASRKRRETRNKLSNVNAEHKVIVMNAEVLPKPDNFVGRSSAELIYLPVDLQAEIERFTSRRALTLQPPRL